MHEADIPSVGLSFVIVAFLHKQPRFDTKKTHRIGLESVSSDTSTLFQGLISLVVLFRRFPVGNVDQDLDLIPFEGASA